MNDVVLLSTNYFQHLNDKIDHLTGLVERQQKVEEAKEVMTIADVAEMLSLSYAQTAKLVRLGEIKSKAVGYGKNSKKIIRREWVYDYLEGEIK